MPKLLYIISFFATVLAGNNTSAQNLRYNFKHLTVQSGLAQNIVYHFLQDSRGYMWLGTRNGITIFDGTRSINYLNNEGDNKTIGGNFITRLLEGPLHQVWVGTDAGVSRYNPADNSFSNFSMVMENGKPKPSFCVPLGFGGHGDMWLLEVQTKSIRCFNTQTGIVDSLTKTTAVDGTLWYDSIHQTQHIWSYLGSGTQHYIFKNKRLVTKETFFTGEADCRSGPALQVLHVLPLNDSTVWLSTTDGLLQLNPLTQHYTIYKSWGTTIVNEIRHTSLAPDGTLWVATGNNGIYTFNIATKTYTANYRHYRSDPFSIGSNNIVSTYFDRVGNIWCGSYGQGASYTAVEKSYFQKALSRNEFDQWEGNNNVKWIGYDNAGGLWCMMTDAGGLWRLNKERKIIEQREPVLENGKKFAGRFYKLVFFGDHYAWCIGKEGLFQYNLLTNRLHKMMYPFFSNELFGSNWVQDLILLHDGSFLFCTFSGLYRITNNNGVYVIQPFSELNKKEFKSFASLHQDEAGNIYVKDQGDGFYVLQISNNPSHDTLLHSYPFSPQVAQFYTDTISNSILLATNFGMYRLSRKNFSLTKMVFKTPPPFSSITGFMKTTNTLWLFGEKGLYRYNEKTNSGRTFTTEDGLPANEFNLSALIVSPDECIAATTNGLVSFSPGMVQEKTYPPLVQLTAMYVNDSATAFRVNPQEEAVVNLSYDQNTFSFDFSPIAFQNAAGCSFQYQLQGYDKDWIHSEKAGYTRYSKIPPGHYVFRVRTVDANGGISPYVKTLQVVIGKAFWQTTFFKIALGLVVAMALFFIIKWYLNKKIRKQLRQFEKQQAIEKERTRIATDMHDDLGAGLSRIKYLSEAIQLNMLDDTMKPDVKKIAFYADEMVDKMGEIVWALNEKNDTLADLIGYTRAYAAEYLSNHNISCHFTSPDTVPLCFINGELRRHIFLSVKECLHNIVKHAGATQVCLVIAVDKYLHVIVHDNGSGINKTAPRPYRNGLANMEKRMREAGGNIEFENKEGTRVTMKIPF